MTETVIPIGLSGRQTRKLRLMLSTKAAQEAAEKAVAFADAAGTNETITRGRVDALEARWAVMDEKGWSGFWARVKWLIFGK